MQSKRKSMYPHLQKDLVQVMERRRASSFRNGAGKHVRELVPKVYQRSRILESCPGETHLTQFPDRNYRSL